MTILLLIIKHYTGFPFPFVGFVNIEKCPLESSLPKVIGIEGVSLLIYMVIEKILHSLSNTRPTVRKSEEDIYSKQHSYFMFTVFFAIYVVYLYVLWIIGKHVVFSHMFLKALQLLKLQGRNMLYYFFLSHVLESS